MAMPMNLIIVRHGESEGNIANFLSRRGNDSMFTQEFIDRHSSTWRLTEKGKQQAAIAGNYIKENISKRFDRYYVSDYDRAKETAALLALPEAQWRVSYYLRERDMGLLDAMPDEKRKKKFAENLRNREMEPFYWTPINGESMPSLCLRLDVKIFDTLHRECSGQDVVLVVHGEVMRAIRYLLERLTHADIMRLERSSNPHDRIHNCQIFHYSKKDPETGRTSSYLKWMRSICPTDLSLSSNEWKMIVHGKFSNDELLREVDLRHLNR